MMLAKDARRRESHPGVARQRGAMKDEVQKGEMEDGIEKTGTLVRSVPQHVHQ